MSNAQSSTRLPVADAPRTERPHVRMLDSKYILAALSVVFLAAACGRLMRDRGRTHPQSRAWLTIAAIFGAVSAFLFYPT